MRLSQINESLMNLSEERIYRDIDPNFDINNIDSEIEKRIDKYEELVNSIDDVENHYIERFRLDLAIIRKYLKEDIEQLDFTDEIAVKELFDNLDFRLKHAKSYVGLAG